MTDHEPRPPRGPRRERLRVRAVGLTWAAALVAGLLVSCLDPLPRGRSCGDGWWDPEFEECDPASADRSYIDACRVQGWDVDAKCNELCLIEDAEADCNRCGDGVVAGDEQCDGDDVRGATCPAGAGQVRCTDACTLDFELCPAECGDGVVNGSEECDTGLACTNDESCGPGRVCYLPLAECVPADDGFAPNLSCGYYDTLALGINKPYASGIVSPCTDDCFFGRNECGFCGDGQLDGSYDDLVFPNGDIGSFPAELCDGDQAVASALEAYCKPLCVDEFIAADVTLFCDFECDDDCKHFAPPGDITPGEDPESIGCCLAEDSPCPYKGTPNVPDLPCCAWAGKPVEQHTCVPSGAIPVSYVCP